MDDTEKCVHKRDYNENTLSCFKQALFEASWNSVEKLKQSNKSCNTFLEIFKILYGKYFPRRKIKIKPKRTLSPWITNDIAKSSKQKQKLHEKYLKQHTPISEENYKAHKNLFKTVKHKPKKRFYSEQFTWCIMKELIGKAKVNKSFLISKNVTETLGETNLAN